jgi:hypothetical protein
MTNTQAFARWESRSGKWWVGLYRDGFGVMYDTGPGGMMGSLGRVDDNVAIEWVELHLGMFQPDAAKTPMKRTI